MMIEWSFEVIIATVSVILIFGVSAIWTKDLKKVGFLLIGFAGLWLAIVQPQKSKEVARVTSSVDNISTFLNSEEMKWTDTVKLVGSDHQLSEIRLLEGYNIKLEDDIIPNGFEQITIPHVIEGREFSIYGKYTASGDSISEIWLTSPSGEQFSASVNEDGSFAIELLAPVKGLYEYQLSSATISKDTISEVVPVQVRASMKMGMLILGNSPQFEFNYLKNYWINEGHAIVQKVRISKEKYSTSYVNIPEFSFSAITPKVLERFDILLMDMISWNEFSSNQRNQILTAVKNEGLGLALKPDKTGDSPKSLPYTKVARFEEVEIGSVPIIIAELDYNKAWKNVDQSLKMDLGFGSVVILGISDSYKLILNDEARNYNNIWGDILSELFVKKNEGFTISTPFLTYESVMVNGQISFMDQDESLILNDSNLIVVNYTPFLDGNGDTKVTGRRGWNKVTRIGTDEIQWFYAFGRGSWELMRANHIKNYIDWMQMNKGEETLESNTEHHEIPWWISILVMIFGFGVVWFWEKMVGIPKPSRSERIGKPDLS